MDSYIVRIYRRGGRKPDDLVGTVEHTGTGRKVAFSGADELWEILRCRKWPKVRVPERIRRVVEEESCKKPMTCVSGFSYGRPAPICNQSVISSRIVS